MKELENLLGREGVLSRPEELLLYEYDAGPGQERPVPDAVVFPRSATDVVRLVRLANQHGVPIVGRGAGTGLSGGALTPAGGLLVVFSRMKRILEVDLANLRAVVEPGVVNLDLTKEVEGRGCYFAPDPSSQKACTIGGNVAENAGGPHTLAYGVTTNHVLGLEVVLPTGELVEVGGAAPDAPGYDLTGLLVGSEGTLAIVTKIAVRLVHLPEAARTLLATYGTVREATNTVSEIVSRGIIPAAMELMDQICTRAVGAWMPQANLPTDAGAVLVIEVEGIVDGLDGL